MFENRTEPAFVETNDDEPRTKSLRSQLVAWCKHIATDFVQARALDNRSELLDAFLVEALDAASSAVQRDEQTLTRLILKADYMAQLAAYLKSETQPQYQKDMEKQIRDNLNAADVPDKATIDELIAHGEAYSSTARLEALGATAFGLHETITSGLVGVASLARVALTLSKTALPKREFEAQGLRARIKGLRPRESKEKAAREELTVEAEKIEAQTKDWRVKERATIDGIAEVLAFLATESTDVDALLDAVKKSGELASTALEIAEYASTFTYGAPTPVSVRSSALQGRCALFSGDDFEVLAELMERADFSEINVWTRGDAIAAHSLPAFKKYRRLVGHYGGSWRDQQTELDAFPGAIVVASSTFDEPDEAYANYVFSASPMPTSRVNVLKRKENGKLDLEQVVRASFDSPGFFKTKASEKIAVGFGGDGLPGLVDKTARAFRQNALKKAFVFGGQDVAAATDDYFERAFDAVPENAPVLTFGDVKFRFNRKPTSPTSFGTPKIVDMGRERDANAALRFVSLFGEELDRAPEKTPVAFLMSLWGEISLATTLALCARGYRDVYVGPRTPSYWTPEIQRLLNEKFGLKLAVDPVADVQAILA